MYPDALTMFDHPTRSLNYPQLCREHSGRPPRALGHEDLTPLGTVEVDSPTGDRHRRTLPRSRMFDLNAVDLEAPHSAPGTRRLQNHRITYG